MTPDERKHAIERIRKTEDRLEKIYKGFSRIRWMAEQEDRSEAFLNVAVAAGKLTENGLEEVANFMDILTSARLVDA